MPSLSELQNRYPSDVGEADQFVDSFETLVVDTRGHMRPADVVELRLGIALERGPVFFRQPSNQAYRANEFA